MGATPRSTGPAHGCGFRLPWLAPGVGPPLIRSLSRSTRWVLWCRIVKHVNSVIKQHSFLTIPTAPGAAPALDCSGEQLETFRARALALTSIAGLCGLPQVTVPVASLDDGPVGLGIVGPRGSDEALLALAERLAGSLSLLQQPTAADQYPSVLCPPMDV